MNTVNKGPCFTNEFCNTLICQEHKFLYQLIRDNLTVSAVQTALGDCSGVLTKYTNGWLANYAKYSAARIREQEPEVKPPALKSTDGVELIRQERRRHLEYKKWSVSHDDEHTSEELAWAAVCHAAPCEIARVTRRKTQADNSVEVTYSNPWPWRRDEDKRDKHNRLKQLIIAGALCAAEIDRLLRAELQDLITWYASEEVIGEKSGCLDITKEVYHAFSSDRELSLCGLSIRECVPTRFLSSMPENSCADCQDRLISRGYEEVVEPQSKYASTPPGKEWRA